MKLLILGGSEHQRQLFDAAISLGVEIVLCDYSDSAVCLSLADKFYKVSTLDYDAIIDIARKEEVDGVITNSEAALSIATKVSNELGLPSNKLSLIETLLNKAKFRDFLKDNGFSVPKALLVKEENQSGLKYRLEEFSYPVIVKPADSSASRGLSKAENSEHALNAVNRAFKYSKSSEVLVEDFLVRDHEYIVVGEIFVYDSEVLFLGILNGMRDKYGSDYISSGISYPSFLSEKRQEIFRKSISRLIELLGIRFGPFNIDALFDKDDNLYFIEINPRNGGNSIPKLLKMSTGIDMNAYNIKSALGMEISKEEFNDYDITPMAVHIIHSNKDGIFDRLSVDRDFIDNVIELNLDVDRGDMVEALVTGDKALGTMILKFKSMEDMQVYASRVDDDVKVILLKIKV